MLVDYASLYANVLYNFHMLVYLGCKDKLQVYVMSLSCWKAIGSPSLSRSMIMLTAFDGHYFRPHGILPTFHI
jgi:hypothetical protein